MKYLILIFLSLYFNEFYSLITLDSKINPNFLIWGISHYEGWIIVISFIILLSYVQNQYVNSTETDSSVVTIFNLLNTLVLKKLILRKRYIDQLHFINFVNSLFIKFQSDLSTNLFTLRDISRNEITVAMARKLQFFNIYVSRNYMDRIYLL